MTGPEQPQAGNAPGSKDEATSDRVHRQRDLVRRAQGGDTAAFSCLVEQYQPGLQRFCRRLVGDGATAQDLSQEALLRALSALPLLDDPQRFGGWLHGIALNLVRTRWRQQAREPLSLDGLAQRRTADDGLVAGDSGVMQSALAGLVVLGPEDVVAEAERAERVRRAIASLPPALGRTVALHYLHGYSCAEIAEALRVPVTTVKTRLFKSRGRLRLVLDAERGSQRAAPPKQGTKGSPMADTAVTAKTAQRTETSTSASTTMPKNVVHCSFCLTPHEQVERLIAGPGQVYICNRCIAKCNDILRREGVPV